MKKKCPGYFPNLDKNLQKVTGNQNACSFPNYQNFLHQSPGYSAHIPAPSGKNTSEKHIPGYNFCGPVIYFIIFIILGNRSY